jgi:DNA-binding LacI/PurR family transcriptional regulator
MYGVDNWIFNIWGSYMERKNVAVFIANIYRNMTKETQYGLIDAAREHNIKLIFFTSFNDNYSSTKYIRYKNYDKGDMSVFMLPKFSDYDGLISLDSYMPDLYKEPVNDIKRTATCPIVSLGDTPDFSYNIVNDQNTSFMEVVEHMVTAHNCKDFVLVSSDRDWSFLRDRERIFKLVMEKYDIPFPEENILYGNLKSGCGEEIVTQILELYKFSDQVLPDAIVCVNDYTAIGVLDALQIRGYKVPNDVLLTGYDDMLQAKYSEPAITTSRQPFENVGKAGIETLVKLWNGDDVEHTQALPGILKLRESCGCRSREKIKLNELRDAYDLIIEKQDDLSLSATNLLLGIYAAETAEDVYNEIEANCLNETGFKNAVLCLADNWEENRTINSPDDLKDISFSVVCGTYKRKPIERGALPAGKLLPDIMMNDPEPYYIFPIHHIQYFLGYFIVSPTLNDLGQLHVKTWLASIGTLLINWHTRYELEKTKKQLNDLS